MSWRSHITVRVMRRLSLATIALFAWLALESWVRAELSVHTDFEGGSAKVISIDSAAGVIRFMPAGNPSRGWPCWWYLRVDGARIGQEVRFELEPSDAVIPQSGPYQGKPLPFSWAAADRAAVSFDGVMWKQTAPGRKDPARVTYVVNAESERFWIAWGPPFTAASALAITERVAASGQASVFELCRSREKRPVPGIRFGDADGRPVVWIQARQHAWESGGSWVCAGFIEWMRSREDLAEWLREHVCVFAIPIMDVDHVASGDGGKEAIPQDHNRDWSAQPHWPEVATAQAMLRDYGRRGQLEVFVDLHNPGPNDKTFFFVSPKESMSRAAAARQQSFLDLAAIEFTGPIPFDSKPRESGEKYHPLWKRISKNWIHLEAREEAIAVTLENAWNTPASTVGGYKANGVHLGRTIARYLRQRAPGE